MDMTEAMEFEAMQEEVKKTRQDVDRLSQMVSRLTDNVDRLSKIVMSLAEFVPESVAERLKEERLKAMAERKNHE